MSTGALGVGDTVDLYGKPYEVRAAKLVEGGPARMLLMTRAGSEAHPFDWWPESSVLREMTALVVSESETR
jgi:hypothetical protein